MDCLSLRIYLFLCVGVFCKHLCLCTPCVFLVPVGPEEGGKSTRTGIIDDSKLPFEGWALNPDPLQEPWVLLTSSLFL